MASDQGQAGIGGVATAGIAQVGAREGSLSAAQARAALRESSVENQLRSDTVQAVRDADAGAFVPLGEDLLLNKTAEDTIARILNNPSDLHLLSRVSIQGKIVQGGFEDASRTMLQGAPEVERSNNMDIIQQMLAGKTINEMTPREVTALMDKMADCKLYSGRSDGDATNPQFVAAIEGLVLADKTIENAMKGGRGALPEGRMSQAFAAAKDKTDPVTSGAPAFIAKMKDFSLAMEETTRRATTASGQSVSARPTAFVPV